MGGIARLSSAQLPRLRKECDKTYVGYNLINNNSFVPVKTSSSVSAATVSATATGITGWAYSSNYLKTTVSLTPGTKYKFSSLVQTTKPLVVYAGGSKLLDIPAGSGVRSAEFTPILPSYEMKNMSGSGRGGTLRLCGSYAVCRIAQERRNTSRTPAASTNRFFC